MEGDGGFYHWLELPEGLNAKDFNTRLFKRGAAILPALDCDMARPHDKASSLSDRRSLNAVLFVLSFCLSSLSHILTVVVT